MNNFILYTFKHLKTFTQGHGHVSVKIYIYTTTL